ncbi:hypothetical protein [Methylobacterium sp. CM6246]
MEVSDMKNPPFCVFTYRDGQQVLAEDVETDIAARTRFASAIDLCKTRDDAHAHRVEMRAGSDLLDSWPPSSKDAA